MGGKYKEGEKAKRIIESRDMNSHIADIAMDFCIQEYIVGLVNSYINEENKIRKQYGICYTKKRLESIEKLFKTFVDNEWSNFVNCSYHISDMHIAYNRGETYDYKKRELLERINRRKSYYEEHSLELIHNMLNTAFININKELLGRA